MIILLIRLQNCIADITEWMSNNILKINEDKTEFIIFNTKGNSGNKFTIEIGNNVIHMSEHVKILGVYLDNAMALEKQISTTCITAYNVVSEPSPLRPLRDLQYGLGEMVFVGCRHLEYMNIWCFNEPK